MSSSQEDIKAILAKCLTRGIPLNPLPERPPKSTSVPHAPTRVPKLTKKQFEQAVANALRYFPAELHAILAPEFAEELREEGHIYMRRFRPTEYEMKAYPVEWYPAQMEHARCIIHMVHNNLDPRVAQFPEELITYGGNGSVLSNWAQYHLLMKYLCSLTPQQTLVMYSGHPHGLFPSSSTSPRLVITNGMVIPNYSSRADYERMYAMGVSQYGQMTAGSYCYIGPQGIVHGTTITILNAGRKYLGIGLSGKSKESDNATITDVSSSPASSPTVETKEGDRLAGKVYLSSGLGGMSGAQGKAGYICGSVTVIAEVDPAALNKRFAQGWVTEKIEDLDTLVTRVKQAKERKETTAIGYLGNIVSVWERFAEETEKTGECLIDLASDQTSLHNPYGGGYYPVQLSFAESKKVMHSDPDLFRKLVQESLVRQVDAINQCVAKGTRFWDYGNCFLLEASRAGAKVLLDESHDSKDGDSAEEEDEGQNEPVMVFRYPSYVQEFMGDIFSLGFGPFRWVCCSGSREDLQMTDLISTYVIRSLLARGSSEAHPLPKPPQRIPTTLKEYPLEADVSFPTTPAYIAPSHTIEATGVTSEMRRRAYACARAGLVAASLYNCAADPSSSLTQAEANETRDQLKDNLLWIESAMQNNLVVGSQARILYADAQARCAIAASFTLAIAHGVLCGPVVLSRDHHDVSGTDSPFRETANIMDGSAFCADMSVHNVIGDAMRGATWVSLHNGGGVGWGEVVNGGFGLVLDGTTDSLSKSQAMLFWDVNNGITRRAWSGNHCADVALARAHTINPLLNVTQASKVDRDALKVLIAKK